ncbi:MAG: dioxygenase [Porticoccaceae bacterium]|nr:dioxygenase [Porticoccaceae bacterium]
MNNRQQKGTIAFLSHGGGPLPLLGDPGHREMVELMAALPELLITPRTIVVVSAHWEEAMFTLTGAVEPELIYDYYGFPAESYAITYPAPGHPALAQQLSSLLNNQGLDTRIDTQRGFDHGLFVPLKMLFPKADIPCLQLSLKNTLNPEEHIRLGNALATLKDENILVIGSGFSFHNLKAFFSPPTPQGLGDNQAFDHWLTTLLANTHISEAQRSRELANWHQAPGARFCHPREEHLIPLHTCYGAAKTAISWHKTINILGMKASFFIW